MEEPRTADDSRKKEARIFHHWLLLPLKWNLGAHGGALGWGAAVQAGRSRVQFPMVSLDWIEVDQFYFNSGAANWHNTRAVYQVPHVELPLRMSK
jgi:hypothetical protein